MWSGRYQLPTRPGNERGGQCRRAQTRSNFSLSGEGPLGPDARYLRLDAGTYLAVSVRPGHAGGVTLAEPGVVIKPHRGGLVFAVAWIGFLCLLMVLGSIGEHSVWGLFLVFVWLPWLLPVVLAARYRLTAAGDTLTYRSPLRTRTWRRGEVEYFEIAYGRWSPRARQIQMHADDGEWVSFAITARSWPRDTAQVGRWYAALEDWRLGASQPALN
jgi:hypothetical protein